MTVSLLIWVLTGALIGVGFGWAFKFSRLQIAGISILAIACAIAGGWFLGLFHVAVGGPYIGSAVNAAIGGVVVPVLFLLFLLVVSLTS